MENTVLGFTWNKRNVHIDATAVAKEMLLWTGPVEGFAQYQQFPLRRKPADSSERGLQTGTGEKTNPANLSEWRLGWDWGKEFQTPGELWPEPEAMGVCDLDEIISQFELNC